MAAHDSNFGNGIYNMSTHDDFTLLVIRIAVGEKELSFLFCVVECDISSLAGTDADGIFNRNNENTSVSNFSRVCGF